MLVGFDDTSSITQGIWGIFNLWGVFHWVRPVFAHVWRSLTGNRLSESCGAEEENEYSTAREIQIRSDLEKHLLYSVHTVHRQ